MMKNGLIVNIRGDKSWYINGKLHKEDGPAIQRSNGDEFWYANGKRHREDGPAIETMDGWKEWWIHGKHHREDGPAIEYVNGDKKWYINGQELSQEQFEHYVEMKRLNQHLHNDLIVNNPKIKPLKV